MLRKADYKFYPHIIAKLSALVKLLQVEKIKFDTAASNFDNRNLRDTLHWLSQENNQYAGELQSQLSMMGVENRELSFERKNSDQKQMPMLSTTVRFDNEGKAGILLECCKSEKQLIGSYRDILNEPHLGGDLRTVLRYQLNGILYVFLQLKLLRDIQP